MKARTILLAALWALVWAAGVRAQEKVIFTLEWLVLGSHAGFFAGLEKGFFKDQGLDVTIHPGRGSGDTAKLVGVGRSDFGMADLGAVIIGRPKGISVRAVAMIIGKAPYVLYSLEPNAVRTPKELEGKKIATNEGNATYILFPAFAEMNRVDPSKVEWVKMSPGSMVPSLLSGQVDLSAHFTGSSPIVEASAAKVGEKAVPLFYKDWGFEIYSNGLVAHQETVAKKPELVRKFLAGALQGVAWAMEHPEEAVDILVKRMPAMDRSVAAKSWKIRVDEILTDEVKKNGLGYMSAGRVRKTLDLVVKYFKVEKPPGLGELYTNDLLPGIMPPKPM